MATNQTVMHGITVEQAEHLAAKAVAFVLEDLTTNWQEGPKVGGVSVRFALECCGGVLRRCSDLAGNPSAFALLAMDEAEALTKANRRGNDVVAVVEALEVFRAE